VPGYLADTGAPFGARTCGYSYGWNLDNTASGVHRGVNDDHRYDAFQSLQPDGGTRVWDIAMPNGAYRVRLLMGDPAAVDLLDFTLLATNFNKTLPARAAARTSALPPPPPPPAGAWSARAFSEASSTGVAADPLEWLRDA
jgi:hypothetical protein